MYIDVSVLINDEFYILYCCFCNFFIIRFYNFGSWDVYVFYNFGSGGFIILKVEYVILVIDD